MLEGGISCAIIGDMNVIKHQKGFSVVELLIVIVIVAAIGVGSWVLYRDHHKKSVSSKTTTSIYAGWKSYCSNYGGLCLKYPPNWKLTTHSITTYTQNTSSFLFAKSGTTDEAVVANPAGTIGVVYMPSNLPPNSGGNPSTLTVVGATPIIGAKLNGLNNLYVIKAYEQQLSTVQESYFVTTAQAAIAQDNMLQLDTHRPSGDDLIENAAYFRNANVHPNDLQQLFISSLPQNLVESTFTSISSAQAGFNNPSVRTGGEILASVTYQ